MAGDDGALHFGGEAASGIGGDPHPYRVDVGIASGAAGRSNQQMTISVYAPGSVPGRDAPIQRISGPIRPGGVDAGIVTLVR